MVQALSDQERKDYSVKLKEAGNKAYGAKDFERAIDLYSKAIELNDKDHTYFSNRAQVSASLVLLSRLVCEDFPCSRDSPFDGIANNLVARPTSRPRHTVMPCAMLLLRSN